MKLSDLKVSKDAIGRGGVWVEDTPIPGCALKVRSTMNPDYQALRSALVAAIPPGLRQKGISGDDLVAIDAACIARTLLVDWRGFTGDDDQPMPLPPPEELEALLRDPEYTILRLAALQAAQTAATQRAASLEADAGNSAAPSAGNASGAPAETSSTAKPKKAGSSRRSARSR
jgi:hypothetical protein